MVDARALADYFKSFETDVCELTVTSRADGTGGTITISDRSLTFNISFSDRRRWEGTFHEPEFQADLEGTATKLVSGLDLLSKIDSGYSEHVLLGVSDQVMCAYAWSELTEMVFGVQPSEVHTCSGPFHSIYPHDVLRESLSIFEADSSIRMRLTPAKNPSNWAVGGQAKFASVDTEYDLTLWLKPKYKPNADKPPALGQKLLSTFRDQDQIAQSDLTWLPC